MALVYIVEDDENIREIEEFALANAGYQVDSFANGADFFDVLEYNYVCFMSCIICGKMGINKESCVILLHDQFVKDFSQINNISKLTSNSW